MAGAAGGSVLGVDPHATEQRRLAIDAAVVVALTVAAFLVRRSGLGPSSLWLDDAWVALVHRVSSFPDVWRMGLTSPGFTVALKMWLDGVGLSSGAAQAIPLVAGSLTPGAVYAVGRRIGLRRVTALTAGLLLAVAPAHATYSVRVKQYAVDGLLVVGLLWLGIRASERTTPAPRWRTLGLGAALATVVSTTVIPAAATITVGALIPHLGDRLRGADRDVASTLRTPPVGWVAGYLAFAVLWGGWMVGGRLSERLHEYWEGFYVEGWSDLPRVATAFVEGLTGQDHGLLVLVLTVLWLGGGASAARWAPRDAALLWGPVVAALLLAGLGMVPLGTGRTELYLYPPVALALAWTVDRAGRSLPRRSHRDAAAVGVLAALVAVVMPVVEVTYPQQDLRPLVEHVEARLGPTDQVLVSPGGAYALALYGPWTTGVRRNQTALGFAPRFTERVTVIRFSGDTSPIARKYGDLPEGTRVWLLSSHVVEERLERAREALGALGFELVDEASRPGAGLELWVRAAP